MSLAALHSSHPYFAKFHYTLPLEIIEEHTKPGHVVLDPFCGSGTTLIAAKALGRHSIGVDANPLACLMARVKTQSPTSTDYRQLDGLIKRCEGIAGRQGQQRSLFATSRKANAVDGPLGHNIHSWFEDDVYEDLCGIKGTILESTMDAGRDAALLAFSRIIVRVSNQETESRYRRVKKNLERGASWQLFLNALRSLVKILRSSKDTLDPAAQVAVHATDTRRFTLPPRSCDLVTTSPPYLNSWDYGLYQKFRMLWLGFDPSAYGEQEIGNHLRALRNGDREISRYTIDMLQVFEKLSVALKPGALCVFVNGESVVSGSVVNTDQILTDCASSVGIAPLSTTRREILGPHYGNHASMKTRNVVSKIKRKKFESILVFRKL